MSHDILTPPTSLVTLKNAFVLTKQILDDKYLSMNHDNLEIAIYLKDLYYLED